MKPLRLECGNETRQMCCVCLRASYVLGSHHDLLSEVVSTTEGMKINCMQLLFCV